MHPRHVSWLESLDPEKLSNALTRDLKSDSEKVRSIHDWIACNISYDVNKWLSFDYRMESISHILWSRRAICLGYSQLFYVLCWYAHIKCVCIQGYDKNIMVDLGDHEYLDEHIWNAVRIDSTWKLIDACWDAGTVQVTKRTFWGKIIYFLSHGKKDRVKYHPHFVKSHTDFYFMRNGSFFATDHLPLNPIWQLNYPEMSISQFEKDSAYYYKRYFDLPNTSSYNSELDSERNAYLELAPMDKAIKDGLEGYNFNHQNHYQPAAAYFYKAYKTMNIFGTFYAPLHPDSATVIRACDTALVFLDKAIAHNDTAGRYMQKQRNELLLNNRKKKNIVWKQNNKLINATRQIEHQLVMGKSTAYFRSKRLNDLTIIQERALDAGVKNNAISYRPTKARILDSIKCLMQLNVLADSIGQEQDRITKAYIGVDSLLKIEQNALIKYCDTDAGIINLDDKVITQRSNLYDDLDYEIRHPKDSLMYIKYPNDSLIFSRRTFVFTPLFKKFNVVIKQGVQLQKNYVKQLRTIKRLAASCVDKSPATDRMKQALDNMNEEFNQVSKLNEKYVSAFSSISKSLRNQIKPTHIEKDHYQREKSEEASINRIRRDYIYNHSKGLLNANKAVKKLLTNSKQGVMELKASYKRKKSGKTLELNPGPLKQ